MNTEKKLKEFQESQNKDKSTSVPLTDRELIEKQTECLISIKNNVKFFFWFLVGTFMATLIIAQYNSN